MPYSLNFLLLLLLLLLLCKIMYKRFRRYRIGLAHKQSLGLRITSCRWRANLTWIRSGLR